MQMSRFEFVFSMSIVPLGVSTVSIPVLYLDYSLI